MKIFGVGLNKTGTKSLGKCLRILGKKHKSIDRDLFVACCNGEMDKLYETTDAFDSFEDWPYPLFYKELFFRYGDKAKFILTERETPARWLESLKSHCLNSNPDLNSRKMAYGYDYPHGYEAEHLAIYTAHSKDVREFFKSHNASQSLLCVNWEKGDGWSEICKFLNVPEPDVEFPNENRKRVKNIDRAKENAARIKLQLSNIQK